MQDTLENITRRPWSRVRDPSRKRSRPGSGGRATGESPSVLVVEHRAPLRQMMTRLLEGAGMQVSALDDGRAALDWLHDSPEPDLLLLDWALPLIRDDALIDWIRDDARWDDMPVIAVLDSLDGVEVVHALGCGVDACVASPFDPAWLVEVVVRYL
ncbi:MAG: response regulator [Burkholderiaceae bacterium]